jgi:D-sedoheptulose 7-phosphate isomerase
MVTDSAELLGWYRGALSDVLPELDQPALHEALKVLSAAHDQGTRVWVMGNGGSALAAQHCETDWSKSVWEATGKALHVRALVNNIGNVTAYGNDLGYDDVFANQLAALGAGGEITLLISGSGNSPNILRAAEKARALGMKTISMSGFGGGKVAALVDTPIVISVQDMQIIEDLHVVFCHLVMKHLMSKGRQ